MNDLALTRPLLRQPIFVAWLLTALVSNVGSWMQGFSEQWLVVQLAGAEAPRWAGRLGFASGLAMLVLTPLGGLLGDRFDRRRLLALSQFWLASVALTMGVLAMQPNGLTLARLLGFATATGVGMALMGPALHSLFPDIVPPDQLTAGSGYMSAQFNVSRIVGPTIAALVLAAAGVATNFLVNALSFVGLIVVAFQVPVVAHRREAMSAGSYRGAIRVCREDASLRAALLVSVVAGFFAWSYHTFVTLYAVRYLGAGPSGAASLLAAYGVGAILGSLYLSRDSGGPIWGRLRLFLGVYGAALVLIGLFPHRWFSLAVAGCLGVAHAIFGNLLSVVIQRQAPERMRGRINALYLMAILGTTPLGNLLAGEVAQRLGFNGVRWVLGGQGVILIATASLLVGRGVMAAASKPNRLA